MSQHDTLTLREALRSIQYEAASLADAQVIALQALNATYPARAALSATQPAQAAQGEPVRHVDPEEIDRKQLRDAMARFVEDNRVQQAAQGAPMSTAKNHHQWLERVSFWAASVAGHPDFESGPIHDAAREIEAEVESLRAGRAVPGWQLVPVEPTREMMDAMPGLPAIGAAGDMDLKNLGWSLKEIQNRHRWMGAIAATPTPPAQPAPVVPDVQREIADALALFPVDLESKTFRVNVYNQSQVIEADGDTQFFSKKKVMALLEKLHGHLTAAATPTPPAQAAADARDAILFESSRWGGADCRLAVWESLRILGSRMGVTVTKEDQYAALATHQQGGK